MKIATIRIDMPEVKKLQTPVIQGIDDKGFILYFDGVPQADNYETYVQDAEGQIVIPPQPVLFAKPDTGIMSIRLEDLQRNEEVESPLSVGKYKWFLIAHPAIPQPSDDKSTVLQESEPALEEFSINIEASNRLEFVRLHRDMRKKLTSLHKEISAITSKLNGTSTPPNEELEEIKAKIKLFESRLAETVTKNDLGDVNQKLAEQIESGLMQIKDLVNIGLKAAVTTAKADEMIKSSHDLLKLDLEKIIKASISKHAQASQSEQKKEIPTPDSEPAKGSKKPSTHDEPPRNIQAEPDEPSKAPVPVQKQKRDSWGRGTKFLAFVLGITFLGIVLMVLGGLIFFVMRDQATSNARSEAVATKATATREMEMNNQIQAKAIDELNKARVDLINEARKQVAPLVPQQPPAPPAPTNTSMVTPQANWQQSPPPKINVKVNNYITVQQPQQLQPQ